MRKLHKTIQYLIYAFIFFLPLQTRWIYQQGFLNGEEWEYGTFSLYGTELLLGLIIVLALVYFFWVLRKQKIKKARKQRVILVVIAFLIFCFLAFLAPNQELAFYKLGQIILAGALLGVILISKVDFKKISWAFILSGLLQAALAIQQFYEQKVVANKFLGVAAQDPSVLGTPVVEANGERVLRAFGTLPHPNILAGFLVISLFLIIGLYVITKNKKLQKYLSLIFVVNLVGLILTMSRAALLVFIVVLFVYAFWARKDKIFTKATARFAIITLFVLFLFFVSFSNLVMSRTLAESRVEKISNATRVEQYKESVSVFKEHWFTGTGLGNYTLALSEQKPDQPTWTYQPVHNSYLLVVNELGLIGVLLVLMFLGYFIVKVKRVGRERRVEQVTGLACLACLAGLALFDHYLWSFWCGLTLISFVFSLQNNTLDGKKVSSE